MLFASKFSLWSLLYLNAVFLFGLLVYYKHSTWSKIKDQHVFVAAAYRVQDLDRRGEYIRMLSAAEGYSIRSRLFCQFNETVVKAKVFTLNRGLGCKWQYYFLECPVKSDFKQETFNLTDVGLTIKHPIQIEKPYPHKHRFVICFSRVFDYENWQSMLLAIHFYKHYEVDHLVIPLISLIKELYTMLKAYESNGFVRLKKALMIPKIPDLDYDPNKEVDVFWQVLNFDSCLYEYRESADFISFLAAKPGDFQLDDFIRSFTWSIFYDYGKSVVRPKFIRHSFIHRTLLPKIELIGSYEHKFINHSNATFILHVRHLIEPEQEDAQHLFSQTKCLQNRDECLHWQKNASLIEKQFREFLSQNHDAEQAFRQLPRKSSARTLNCPQLQVYGNCFSPIVCRKNETNNDSFWVVVDENATKRTTKFFDLQLHTTD